MSSLQQLLISNFGDLPVDAFGAAVHRRSQSILFFSPDKSSFSVVRRQGDTIESKWQLQGTWSAPSTLYGSAVIFCAAVESMDSFVIAITNEKVASVIFLDVVDARLLSICEISSSLKPKCAEFDQNRKELHIGFSSGVLMSFMVRLAARPSGNLGTARAAMQSLKNGTEGSSRLNKVVQTIIRKQTKLLGGADNANPVHVVQIASLDIVAAILVLAEGGYIFCLESASHDLLWTVNKNIFAAAPTALFVDKFGSDFVVACTANDKKETIEYWAAPRDVNSAHANMFTRCSIPLSGKLVSLCLETVGGGVMDSPILAVGTNDRKMQIYRADAMGTMLFQQSNVIISGSNNHFAVKRKKIPTLKSSTSAKGAAIIKRPLNPKKVNFTAYNEFQGVNFFCSGASSLPDCPVVYFSTKLNSVCALGVYYTNKLEESVQRDLMDIALRMKQLEIMELRTKAIEAAYASKHNSGKGEQSGSAAIVEVPQYFKQLGLPVGEIPPGATDLMDASRIPKAGSISPPRRRIIQPSASSNDAIAAAGDPEKDGEVSPTSPAKHAKKLLFGSDMDDILLSAPTTAASAAAAVASARAGERQSGALPSTDIDEVFPHAVELSAGQVRGRPPEGSRVNWAGFVETKESSATRQELGVSVPGVGVFVHDHNESFNTVASAPLGNLSRTVTAASNVLEGVNVDGNGSLVYSVSESVASKSVASMERHDNLQRPRVADAGMGHLSSAVSGANMGPGPVKDWSAETPQQSPEKSYVVSHKNRRYSIDDELPDDITVESQTSDLRSETTSITVEVRRRNTEGPDYDAGPGLYGDRSAHDTSNLWAMIPFEDFDPQTPEVTFFAPLQGIVPSAYAPSASKGKPTVAANFVGLMAPPSSFFVSSAVVSKERPPAVPVATFDDAPNKRGRKGPPLPPPPPQQQIGPKLETQMLTESGLGDVGKISHARMQIKIFEVQYEGIAYRSGILAVVTSAVVREIVFYTTDVNPSKDGMKDGAPNRPIRQILDLQPHVNVTAFAVADVSVRLPPQKIGTLGRPVMDSTGDNGLSIGSLAISLAGDSEGRVHFVLSSKSKLIGSGAWRAHLNSVVTILTTGDAARPLWRIEAEASPKGDQMTPLTTPGSAVITIAEDGEVNVWQPIFTLLDGAKYRPDQMLTMHNITWRLSGSFMSKPSSELMVRKMNGTDSRTVQTACLDPTCMTLILGLGDGAVQQWPVPGIIDVGSGPIATCQDKLWEGMHHYDSVDMLRPWINLVDTAVGEASEARIADPYAVPYATFIDVRGASPESFSAAGFTVTAAASSGSRTQATQQSQPQLLQQQPQPRMRKYTIGYGTEELKQRVDNSTMVSSSSDFSILLWKFVLPKLAAGQAITSLTKYLALVPCRRFVFSSTPSHGICFCSLGMGSGISVGFRHFDPDEPWQISALVGGQLVTVVKMRKESLFQQDDYSLTAVTTDAGSAANSVITDSMSVGSVGKNPSASDSPTRSSGVGFNSTMSPLMLSAGAEVKYDDDYKSARGSIDVISKDPSSPTRSVIDSIMEKRKQAIVTIQLPLQPVVCLIERPARTLELMSKRLPAKAGFSWTVLDSWISSKIAVLEEAKERPPSATKKTGGTLVDSTTAFSAAVSVRMRENFLELDYNIEAELPPPKSPLAKQRAIETAEGVTDGRERVIIDGIRMAIRHQDIDAMKTTLKLRKESPKRVLRHATKNADDESSGDDDEDDEDDSESDDERKAADTRTSEGHRPGSPLSAHPNAPGLNPPSPTITLNKFRTKSSTNVHVPGERKASSEKFSSGEQISASPPKGPQYSPEGSALGSTRSPKPPSMRLPSSVLFGNVGGETSLTSSTSFGAMGSMSSRPTSPSMEVIGEGVTPQLTNRRPGTSRETPAAMNDFDDELPPTGGCTPKDDVAPAAVAAPFSSLEQSDTTDDVATLAAAMMQTAAVSAREDALNQAGQSSSARSAAAATGVKKSVKGYPTVKYTSKTAIGTAIPTNPNSQKQVYKAAFLFTPPPKQEEKKKIVVEKPKDKPTAAVFTTSMARRHEIELKQAKAAAAAAATSGDAAVDDVSRPDHSVITDSLTEATLGDLETIAATLTGPVTVTATGTGTGADTTVSAMSTARSIRKPSVASKGDKKKKLSNLSGFLIKEDTGTYTRSRIDPLFGGSLKSNPSIASESLAAFTDSNPVVPPVVVGKPIWGTGAGSPSRPSTAERLSSELKTVTLDTDSMLDSAGLIPDVGMDLDLDALSRDLLAKAMENQSLTAAALNVLTDDPILQSQLTHEYRELVSTISKEEKALFDSLDDATKKTVLEALLNEKIARTPAAGDSHTGTAVSTASSPLKGSEFSPEKTATSTSKKDPLSDELTAEELAAKEASDKLATKPMFPDDETSRPPAGAANAADLFSSVLENILNAQVSEPEAAEGDVVADQLLPSTAPAGSGSGEGEGAFSPSPSPSKPPRSAASRDAITALLNVRKMKSAAKKVIVKAKGIRAFAQMVGKATKSGKSLTAGAAASEEETAAALAADSLLASATSEGEGKGGGGGVLSSEISGAVSSESALGGRTPSGGSDRGLVSSTPDLIGDEGAVGDGKDLDVSTETKPPLEMLDSKARILAALEAGPGLDEEKVLALAEAENRKNSAVSVVSAESKEGTASATASRRPSASGEGKDSPSQEKSRKKKRNLSHAVEEVVLLKSATRSRAPSRATSASKSGAQTPVPKRETEVKVYTDVDTLRTSDRDVTLKIFSSQPGRVICAVLKADAAVPQVMMFQQYSASPQSMKAVYKDVVSVAYKDLSVSKDDEITVSGLRSSTQYKVYCWVDCEVIYDLSDDEEEPAPEEGGEGREERRCRREEARKARSEGMEKGDIPRVIAMDDGALARSTKMFKTHAERLEIEWTRLNDMMQSEEVRAASKQVYVQQAARKDSVLFPTEAEIALRYENNAQGKQAHRKWEDFVEWWIGEERVYGYSRIRCRFLLLESLCAAQDAAICESCVENGYLNQNQMDVVKDFAASFEGQVKDDDHVKIDGHHLMKIFRSWYKGGDVVRDHAEKEEIKRQAVMTAEAMGVANRRGSGVPSGTSTAAGSTAGSAVGSAAPSRRGSAGIRSNRLRKQSLTLRQSFADSVGAQSEGPRKTSILHTAASRAGSDVEDGEEGGGGRRSSMRGSRMTDTVEMIAAKTDPVADACVMQLFSRQAFLMSRIAKVDACRIATNKLVEGFRLADRKKLKEDDIEERGWELATEELNAIMAAKKLLELSIAAGITTIDKGITVALVKDLNYQKLTDCDLFGACDVLKLKPDKPPVVQFATLPGTRRRPLKPWQMCTEHEKMLELVFACSLDSVLHLAIMSRVPVPDPEDIYLDPKMSLMRTARWKTFAAWYAGDEGKNPRPGMGVPTHARVLVSELWEARAIDSEEGRFLFLQMDEMNMDIPQYLTDPSGAGGDDDNASLSSLDSAGKAEDGDGPKISEFTPIQINVRLMEAGVDVVDPLLGESSSIKDHVKEKLSKLVKYYRNMQHTDAGRDVRVNLFRDAIKSIQKFRRFGMLRNYWPPGPARRFTNQFMLPRMGLITPKLQMPTKRFRLYPSVSLKTYTLDEILAWYSPEAMDEDDKIMRKTELKAQRHRAYLAWIALEPQRQAETRSMMVEEDIHGAIHRAYFQKVEQQLKTLPEECPWQKTFAVAAQDLPGDYDYIKNDTVDYEHGSGLYNEDELEDLAEERRQAAQRAHEMRMELKRKMEEDRLRREKEEKERLKKELRDRRLAEGAERRRLLREHLAEVKLQRVLAKEAEAEAKAEQERIAAEEAAIEAERRRILHLEQLERDRVQSEIDGMFAEEVWQREAAVRRVELLHMEHEDIMSILRERAEEEEELRKDLRRMELEKLYSPFVPRTFKKDGVRFPQLHSLLLEDSEEGFDGSLVRSPLIDSQATSSWVQSASQVVTSPKPRATQLSPQARRISDMSLDLEMWNDGAYPYDTGRKSEKSRTARSFQRNPDMTFRLPAVPGAIKISARGIPSKRDNTGVMRTQDGSGGRHAVRQETTEPLIWAGPGTTAAKKIIPATLASEKSELWRKYAGFNMSAPLAAAPSDPVPAKTAAVDKVGIPGNGVLSRSKSVDLVSNVYAPKSPLASKTMPAPLLAELGAAPSASTSKWEIEKVGDAGFFSKQLDSRATSKHGMHLLKSMSASASHIAQAAVSADADADVESAGAMIAPLRYRDGANDEIGERSQPPLTLDVDASVYGEPGNALPRPVSEPKSRSRSYRETEAATAAAASFSKLLEGASSIYEEGGSKPAPAPKTKRTIPPESAERIAAALECARLDVLEGRRKAAMASLSCIDIQIKIGDKPLHKKSLSQLAEERVAMKKRINEIKTPVIDDQPLPALKPLLVQANDMIKKLQEEKEVMRQYVTNPVALDDQYGLLATAPQLQEKFYYGEPKPKPKLSQSQAISWENKELRDFTPHPDVHGFLPQTAKEIDVTSDVTFEDLSHGGDTQVADNTQQVDAAEKAPPKVKGKSRGVAGGKPSTKSGTAAAGKSSTEGGKKQGTGAGNAPVLFGIRGSVKQLKPYEEKFKATGTSADMGIRTASSNGVGLASKLRDEVDAAHVAAVDSEPNVEIAQEEDIAYMRKSSLEPSVTSVQHLPLSPPPAVDEGNEAEMVQPAAAGLPPMSPDPALLSPGTQALSPRLDEVSAGTEHKSLSGSQQSLRQGSLEMRTSVSVAGRLVSEDSVQLA